MIHNQSGCQTQVGYVVDLSGPDGMARAWLDVTDQHSNRVGLLHGGLISMLLDAALGYAASRWFSGTGDPTTTPVVTVSLTVNFAGPARIGQRVTATGLPANGGRTLAHATGEIRDDQGRLIATATGVFRRISDQKAPT